VPGLSFHHLPLHNEIILTKWLVDIKRISTQVNEYSCSAVIISKEEKEGKDDISMTFA